MQEFDWENNIENKEQKLELAKKIANRVKDGDVIGFGSGSTSYLAAKEIAKKAKEENLHIKAIPTSNIIENLCKELNIEITSLDKEKPDWCFDGADEVDENNWLIKGMGAALYKEKLNIRYSNENYILVDETKFVERLGEKHPVPVECEESSIEEIKQELLKMGATKVELRKSNNNPDKPLITDNGNIILHAWFNNITKELERNIRSIDGVLESGLFIGYNIIIIK